MSTKWKMMAPVSNPVVASGNKVTVVGCGQVGMACAFSLVSKGITTDLALLDTMAGKLEGEKLDLQHGSMFMGNPKISASTEYYITANSRVIVVTAGVRQKDGESRMDLVDRNTAIFKVMIPKLIEYSPNAVLLIVTNPVDILTYVAWKLSGLPKNRVFGSGTNLDSSRFRFLMSQRLNLAPTSCHGYIIGEHGDSSVPVWSGVNIAGIRLLDINPNVGTEADTEKWSDMHSKVVRSAFEIIKLKGYTSWGIGLSVAAIVNAIIGNSFTIHAVSTYIKGFHGINDDVFLSLPAVLGHNGICSIITQTLTEDEKATLQQSAKIMQKIQSNLSL